MNINHFDYILLNDINAYMNSDNSTNTKYEFLTFNKNPKYNFTRQICLKCNNIDQTIISNTFKVIMECHNNITNYPNPNFQIV